ncbi:unnamed protein product [Somion occarium]|uniref:Uncharacterized protein n=1 Tax=Somion occarium TaxID=3059160 RepID=A0ABP1E4T0_9APHY
MIFREGRVERQKTRGMVEINSCLILCEHEPNMYVRIQGWRTLSHGILGGFGPRFTQPWVSAHIRVLMSSGHVNRTACVSGFLQHYLFAPRLGTLTLYSGASFAPCDRGYLRSLVGVHRYPGMPPSLRGDLLLLQ